MLVPIEQGDANMILDRYDGVIEIAVVPGVGRAFLAFAA